MSEREPVSSALPAPRAVLFDLDGTLIDSIELIVRSFQHTAATHLDVPLSRGVIVASIGRSLKAELASLAPGRGDALLETYRAFMFANHDALVTVYPGVLDMLRTIRARGIPIGLVTSKARVSAAPAFAKFLLDREMSAIVTEDDTARHKPHPDPLLHAARLLAVPPAACWYVGDSTHDLLAAHAAGMAAIAAAWGPTDRTLLAPLADAIAETPEGVLTLLGVASRVLC